MENKQDYQKEYSRRADQSRDYTLSISWRWSGEVRSRHLQRDKGGPSAIDGEKNIYSLFSCIGPSDVKDEWNNYKYSQVNISHN